MSVTAKKGDIYISKEFIDACKNATMKAFSGKIDNSEVEKFLSKMPNEALATTAGVPDPAEAKGETYTVAIYGYVKCTPTHLDHYFEANHWGLGLAGVSAYGFMYTAYDSYEALFSETRGYHAQGVAEGGGFLQITWFNGSGVPIGQFNGAAGGIGIFEVGGEGRWTKK